MYRAAVNAQRRGVFATSLALLLSACVSAPVSVETSVPPQVMAEDSVSSAYPVHIYALDEDASFAGSGGVSAMPEAAGSSMVMARATEMPKLPEGLPAPVQTPARESVEICEAQPAPSIYYFDSAAPSLLPATGMPASAPLQNVTAAKQVPEATQPQPQSAASRRLQSPLASNAATMGRVPVAAAASFTIGAGDTVQIDVLGRPELTARGSVSDDGQVICALIGPVAIAGLTPLQAAERIAESYRAGQYLVLPQVTVTITDYQSQLLTVLGEVGRPGRFPIRTRLSVLDALALSGGITELGASTAYLLRPEESLVTRYEIDLDALIQTGAGQQYFDLFAGDILVVPKAEVFYIYGEVRNPNAYKIKPGITVIQALSLAGGLTDKGTDRRIDIRRSDDSGKLRTLSVSLNEPLLPDDVIYIRERWF